MKAMQTITIITPTYNRAGLLEKLYLSLERQSCRDFEWLIVDDGSTDRTKEVVEKIIREASFHIDYIWKENGGKHTALNVGIKTIHTELTMIVDSDDQLLPNAVDEICKVHYRYSSRDEIGVYSFLKCYSSGKPVVSLDAEEFVNSYVKYRIKENRPGDMAEVFRTSVLKKYPFPEFRGERFLSEDIVWIKVGLKYQFVFVNKPIYQCEYLDGGLTANDKPMKFASPCGSMLRGKMLMNRECGIIQNLKGAIIYDCYRRNVHDEHLDERLKLNFKDKVMCILCMPISIYYFTRWRKNSIK